ncbi:hypothetical protein M6B38_159595 [Iris pallida]|uniref:Uncharacterized protein n=1 Tax=Iris pallida TaxID=29817 RepID=A0AAX6F0N9_IRIPA|nr:hypothetical protein M6B38_236560 [Iris pallida]KAJ6809864.1 hypothetical protein M6B38_159595 [Iris pallida]
MAGTIATSSASGLFSTIETVGDFSPVDNDSRTPRRSSLAGGRHHHDSDDRLDLLGVARDSQRSSTSLSVAYFFRDRSRFYNSGSPRSVVSDHFLLRRLLEKSLITITSLIRQIPSSRLLQFNLEFS